MTYVKMLWRSVQKMFSKICDTIVYRRMHGMACSFRWNNTRFMTFTKMITFSGIWIAGYMDKHFHINDMFEGLQLKIDVLFMFCSTKFLSCRAICLEYLCLTKVNNIIWLRFCWISRFAPMIYISRTWLLTEKWIFKFFPIFFLYVRIILFVLSFVPFLDFNHYACQWNVLFSYLYIRYLYTAIIITLLPSSICFKNNFVEHVP